MRKLFLVEKDAFERASDFLVEYTSSQEVLDALNDRIMRKYEIVIRGETFIYIAVSSEKKVRNFRNWLEQYSVEHHILEVN